MMNLFQSIEFARVAHGEQQYGKLPYYYHLSEVLSFVGEYSNDPNAYQAAVFHDILEDTYVTEETLETLDVPLDVICATVLVTDPEGANRLERKQKLYDQFEAFSEGYVKDLASLVKLCDRFVNQRNSILDRRVKTIKMYYSEFEHFMKVFVVPSTPMALTLKLFEQRDAMKKIIEEE